MARRAQKDGDAAEVAMQEGGLDYELFAVLIHSGTAVGGHYFAYIKDLTEQRWYDFNDSCVSECTDSALAAMLNSAAEHTEPEPEPEPEPVQSTAGEPALASEPAPAGGLAIGPDGQWAKRVSSANGYMLVYRHSGRAAPAVGDDEVPSAVQAEVAAENATHAAMAGLHAFQRRLVALAVHTTDGRKATLELLQETTLLAAAAAARDAVVASGPAAGGVPDRYAAAAAAADGELRLRRFSPHSGKAGETFGGKEGSTCVGMTPRPVLIACQSFSDALFTQRCSSPLTRRRT